MKTKDKKRAITVRFEERDIELMEVEAEKRGGYVTDVIRDSWARYQKQDEIKQHLIGFELRQRKNTFEMLCAVIGLKSDEREQALAQLHKIGVKW
jgi:hypothetical protein